VPFFVVIPYRFHHRPTTSREQFRVAPIVASIDRPVEEKTEKEESRAVRLGGSLDAEVPEQSTEPLYLRDFETKS